jgi:hypothetical protein
MVLVVCPKEIVYLLVLRAQPHHICEIHETRTGDDQSSLTITQASGELDLRLDRWATLLESFIDSRTVYRWLK